MLGKLMKYEWKSTWKLLVPMNVLIIVMSLFAYLTIRLEFFDTDSELVFLSGITIILFYMLSMFVVVIGTAIYLIYRFYTSVYGDQGYLLHTLPVDKHHIIISKVLVSVLWLMLSVILIYLSVFLLFSSDETVLETVWDMMVDYVERLGLDAFAGGLTIVMTIIAFVFQMLARVLKVTACISLGQLTSNHKVLTSFAFYYGIYFVQRIFSIMYYVIYSVIDDDFTSMYQGNWETSLIAGIVYCVVFYFITWYLMEKKLNLD